MTSVEVPRSNAVKIGVPGSSRIGVPSASIKLSQTGTDKSAPAANSTATAAFQESLVNASYTMAELCAGSFYKKHIGKRKPELNVADAETGNKSKQKKSNTSTISSSINSSSQISSSQGASLAKHGASQENKGSTGPRVEIINGRIVVKESSLLLNNATTAIEDDYEEVVEGVHATATYSSFLKRRPSPAWGLEETRLFYTALRQCGLEYTMMQAFFPGRTRLQLKRKFMREEKSHPELIQLALETSLPLDLSPFEATLGTLSLKTNQPTNTSSEDNHVITDLVSAACHVDSDIIEV